MRTGEGRKKLRCEAKMRKKMRCIQADRKERCAKGRTIIKEVGDARGFFENKGPG